MLNISANQANINFRANDLQQSQWLGRTERGDKSATVSSDSVNFGAEVVEDQEFMSALELNKSDADSPEDKFEDYLKRIITGADAVITPEEAQEMAEDVEKTIELIKKEMVQASQNGGSSSLGQKELEEIIRQVSGGSSQQGLKMMKILVEKAANDPQFQESGIGPHSLMDYAAENEAVLTAARNIADSLSSAPSKASESADRILNLYEQSVVSSQGVLQTFQRLGKSEGIGKISDWKKFLTEAVASDLTAQRSSSDKNKLQLILQELKGFRLFNTMVEGLERVEKFIAPAAEQRLP